MRMNSGFPVAEELMSIAMTPASAQPPVFDALCGRAKKTKMLQRGILVTAASLPKLPV